MLAGAAGNALCLLEFTDRPILEAQLTAIRSLFGLIVVRSGHALFDEVRGQLDAYFAGTRTAFTIPLEYPGTDFQRKVWRALRDIPCGQTRSYGEIARAIGNPAAARAVGRANGSNRIAIIIPCHRVIAAGGGPGGYGGGLWRKQRLLELERSLTR